VVDPDGAAVTARLQAAGMQVTCCPMGSDALVALGTAPPDAVLISPWLPDLPTCEVVATMRRFGVRPVLLGVGSADAEVAGPVLLAGATAVVCRPYDAEQVVRHLADELPAGSARAPVEFGPLTLDPSAHTVHLADRELGPLPLKEFELLHLLMRHGDRVVSSAEIRSALWGGTRTSPSPNAIAIHAGRLRNRLRPPLALRTVRGLGYRLTTT
jgi:DNA-binding response OmpR family regulator